MMTKPWLFLKRNYKLFAICLIVLVALCCLMGCTPSTNVAVMQIESANYLNPDINGRASPVVVTFYQLTAPFRFRQASYNAITDNSARVLGRDLLDKQSLEIRPGSQKILHLQLDSQVRYLGIVAAYRNMNQANWHQLIKINPKMGNPKIKITLDSQSVDAKLLKTEWFQ